LHFHSSHFFALFKRVNVQSLFLSLFQKERMSEMCEKSANFKSHFFRSFKRAIAHAQKFSPCLKRKNSYFQKERLPQSVGQSHICLLIALFRSFQMSTCVIARSKRAKEQKCAKKVQNFPFALFLLFNSCSHKGGYKDWGSLQLL